MGSDSALERTIEKIVHNTEEQILSNLKEALKSSQDTLSNSHILLEQEYDRIISEGKKKQKSLKSKLSAMPI